MTVAAYLFDMDGLLLDTERVYLEVGLPLLQGLGMSAAQAEATFLSLVGSSSAETNRKLMAVAGDATKGAALEQAWRAAHRARLQAGIPIRPTVRDTLNRLSARGAVMAVVTSTKGANARHHLAQAGLAAHFQLVVGGDEVPANKPDPAPYLQAAATLGVDPTRCAAFEDSDRGIASAVHAGCIATQIPDLRPANTPLPDLGQRVADTLAEAVAAVETAFSVS